MVMVKKVKEDLGAKVVKEVKEAGEANKAVNKEALVANRVSVDKNTRSRTTGRLGRPAGWTARRSRRLGRSAGRPRRLGRSAGW
jgi:hypothetical protein